MFPSSANEPKNITNAIIAIITSSITPIAIQNVILVHRAASLDAFFAWSKRPLLKSDSTFDAFTMAAIPIRLNTFPHSTNGSSVTKIDSTIHVFGNIGTSALAAC